MAQLEAETFKSFIKLRAFFVAERKITIVEAKKLLPPNVLSRLTDQQIIDIIEVMYTSSEYIFNHILAKEKIAKLENNNE